ncbi:GIY-YIG nuclease family protein [Bacillus mycoides]|uniref:GIY-YIG nuclease family protein n=1 Tax=Bacillus mycoides TaxID=1405 RepID=UPI003D0746A3
MVLQDISSKYLISDFDIHFIYCIENTENKMIYIGLTNNLKQRISAHLYQLETNIHFNTKMQSDFIKFGKDKFLFSIVCTAKNREEAFIKEREYINELNKSNRLYNSILYIKNEKSNKMEMFEVTENIVTLYIRLHIFSDVVNRLISHRTKKLNLLMQTDDFHLYKEEFAKIIRIFLNYNNYLAEEIPKYNTYLNLIAKWCHAKEPHEHQFISEFINYLDHLIKFYEDLN